jgi:hypothetical protein
MRTSGLVLALLTPVIELTTACAMTGSPWTMQGQSGPIAWEIADPRQALEENGTRMRWNFTFVLKNTGVDPFDFERVEVGSRAGGPADIMGGMATEPFARHLEPGGELRVTENETWGCPQCPPGRLARVFSDGVIVYYTWFGHDGAGRNVRVPIAVHFNSSFGARE